MLFMNSSLLQFFLVLFLTIFTDIVYSQTLNIVVKDEQGKKISPVIITTSELSDSLNVKEYFDFGDSETKVKLLRNYGELLIRASSYSYYPDSKRISKPNKDSTYSVKLLLKQKPPIELNDIIVRVKKKPYKINKDTVSYAVSAYSDVSNRKIQDIIKKLPGIRVNEQSGEIKYKGKSIETVTLDGDNLFGFNYSLGTKNINVDMVEQIEAIDNYAENPLLKDIEQGGKVSLNLKLKKGQIDMSGNLDYGSGWFEGGEPSYNINSNILGITKSYKSFATLAYNNIGINRSPFDYFGFNYSLEQQKEKDYFADKIIPETLFSNLLDDNRANINNQFFGNYNAVFRLNHKLSVKTNLYYLQDRINTNQIFENQYQIYNQEFITSDNTFITKKPQQYRVDLELKYNTSKTSLLEYNLRVRQENIETPNQIIQNQNNEFSSFLKTEDFYLKQDLLWTKKLSDRKAFQVSLFHSFNDLPQRFTITPSLFNQNAENDVQESQFKKTFLEGKATYLGSGKRDKYSFILGVNLNNSPFESRLFNSEEIISKNNFDYSQKNIFNTGVYNFNRDDWQISPSYSVRYLNQNLNQKVENQEQNQDNFIFEPVLKIKYVLNSVSFLTTNLEYNQKSNAEQYFFLNQVLINNRTTIENLPSLELQKIQRYSLLYFNNDLYNQFQLNANVGYQKSTGNFFTNSSITENATQIVYFFLPQDNSNWNINLQVSKYLPFIESTVKLTSSYSISNFKNIVNNSQLRNNQSQFLSNALFWKTAFDTPVNLENTFTWQYANSQSQNQQAFINNTWQNKFKIIVKYSKKWFLILSSDYYLPDTSKKNENFLFIDATLRHRPKSKKWEASLVMKNLNNEKNFEQVQTSDISTTIFRSNLLPSYFLLNLTWNF